jgi:hypothetical protein
MSYALVIPANTSVRSNIDFAPFIITEDVDFSSTSSVDISYYNEDFFIAKKSVNVISAEIKTTTVNFSPNSKFASTTIQDNNLIQILEVTGSDGDRWYEVPYLAQETIFEPITNATSGSSGIDYLLKIKRVPKRFVTRVKSTGSMELQFGAGVSTKLDTDIIPTLDNINLGLVFKADSKRRAVGGQEVCSDGLQPGCAFGDGVQSVARQGHRPGRDLQWSRYRADRQGHAGGDGRALSKFAHTGRFQQKGRGGGKPGRAEIAVSVRSGAKGLSEIARSPQGVKRNPDDVDERSRRQRSL